MGYDPDACILCNRCVRYTQEVMQCSALSLEGRGGHARIVPTWGAPGSTPSASSAAAASRSARPARSTRSSRRARRAAERQLEQVRTTCTFCGVGCQIDLNLDPQTKHIVKVTSKDEYLPNEGNLCVKGRFAFNFVHHPDRLTAAARARRGRRAPRDDVGARARDRGRRPARGHRPPRAAVGRLPRLGPADERGELPHPEARAGGGRDELRPLLRVDLTRSHPLRPGQVVRQRSKHQLDPRDRERPLPLRHRVEHDRGAPGARAADQEGGPQGRDARRRRPAQDLADEAREAPPAAPSRHGRLAAERDDAHDPRGGPPGRGVHPRAHRRLRRGARGRHALHARGGGEGHGRPRRGHPRDRARVRARAARGDLLHARDHRARVRRGQHLVALEPRAHDRPPRLRVDRAERAARPEQRAGPERLGRQPVLPPRLPVGRRPRDPAEVLRGAGASRCRRGPATGSTRSSPASTTGGSRRST